MKHPASATVAFAICLLMAFSSCSSGGKKSQDKEETKAPSQEEPTLPSTGSFGANFPADGAREIAVLPDLFIAGDTVTATLTGHIVSSCKHSGCWMDLEMGNGKRVHVTFAQEAFTIPLDAEGKQAVVTGKATRELIPVETLKNYARDDGKPESEVALIAEPEYVYSFVATGVLIR